MAARTLALRTGLLALLQELRYTLVLITNEPLAAAQVAAFQALRDEWKTVLLLDIDILELLASAQAAIDKADDNLDDFAGRVFRAVEDFTGQNPKHPLVGNLFKGKTQAKFKRPVLNAQLEAQRDWVTALPKVGSPTLAALATELVPLIEAADQALELQKTAQQKNREHRDIGARKQLVDKLNAARKEAYGALSKLPFEHPNLASDFADRFFRTDTLTENDEETMEDVKAAIAELETELLARKAQLAIMEAAAAALAKAEAEKKAKEDTLAGLEAQQAELAKKAAELKAQLNKK